MLFRSRELVHSTSHEYPERTVALFFCRCSLTRDPRPLLGQEMRWVRRDALAALRFPPADAELITMLAGTAAG